MDTSVDVYYVKFKPNYSNLVFYKVGVTSNTVEYRLSGNNIDIIDYITAPFNTRKEAVKHESIIKFRFRKYVYKGSPILKDGNSEVFTRDVLNWDLFYIEKEKTILLENAIINAVYEDERNRYRGIRLVQIGITCVRTLKYKPSMQYFKATLQRLVDEGHLIRFDHAYTMGVAEDWYRYAVPKPIDAYVGEIVEF